MSTDKYLSIFSRQMEAIVYMYHGSSANQNPGIALYNDPVFNKGQYNIVKRNE